MSVGSWNPGEEHVDTVLTIKQLQRFASLGTGDTLDNLDGLLSDEEKSLSEIMRWDSDRWVPLLEQLDSDALIALMRFFTVAEMKLAGWDAGLQSPVIVINRLLKTRGYRLERELLVWIRANSSNRFIPNGAVL